MTKRFSFVIAWGCVATLLVVPVIAIYLFFRIDILSTLASHAIPLPIQWTGVITGQWYGFWLLTVLYVTPGLLGLYYLRRAFSNFAKGELFTASNSQDLRRLQYCCLSRRSPNPFTWHYQVFCCHFITPQGKKC